MFYDMTCKYKMSSVIISACKTCLLKGFVVIYFGDKIIL